MTFLDVFRTNKGDNRVISSGTFDGREASIIHLENIKNHTDYPILIHGKKYLLKRSDKNHLWLIESNLTKGDKS